MSSPRTESKREIARLLGELAWKDRQRFARLVGHASLTVPRYFALREIGELGPNVAMGKIGQAIDVPPSSMTSIIDRLVEDGLVTRGASPHDRRAVVASLTPAGAELVKKIESLRNDESLQMLSRLGDQDVHHLAGILARLLESERPEQAPHAAD